MRDFLEFIQGSGYRCGVPPDGYTEIRAIKNGQVEQHFEEDRLAASELALELSDDGWDAYYGVLPRVRAAGDATAVALTTTVLWADLDARDVSGGKSGALQHLVDYAISPSVVVDSGHGYHAYWKLSAPIPTPRGCVIMRGLAKQLWGDHVYDAPRILRIPGTTNWKDPDEPLPVRVLRFDTTRLMRAGDFDHPEYLGNRQLVAENYTHPERPYVPPADRKPLPDWLDQLIRDGVPQGQRSEQSFKVMIYLARFGWSDAEIIDVFDTSGIGEKYREMRSGGMRWLMRSLAKARQQA